MHHILPDPTRLHLHDKRDWAVWQAERGRKVLRLPPGRKFPPLGEGWPDFPKNTPEQIRQLWTGPLGASEDHNIAIQTGLGFIVLDFDTKHGGDRALARLDPMLPDTFRVETPNGMHVYLAHDEPMRNGADILAHLGMPGVDLRAHHGYVVGPGSIVDGKCYGVDPHEGGEIAPAPQCILDLIGDRKVAPPAPQEPVAELDSDDAFRLANAWLHSASGLNGESCDGRTFKTAARLKDFGISEDAAVEMLFEHEAEVSDLGDTDAMERAIRNAYRYAAENPPGIEVARLAHHEFQPVPGDDGPKPQLGARENAQIEFPSAAPAGKPGESRIKLERLDTIEIAALEWLVRDLIPAGSLAALYGKPGSYKSFVALHMAAMLGRDQPVFGKPARRPEGQPDIVYIAAEGGFGIGKRRAAFGKVHPGPMDRVYVVRQPLDFRSSTKDAQKLADTISDAGLRPCLVIVDTLARTFAGGAENSSEDMGAYVGIMDSLRTALGCTVLLVHHSGKDQAKGMRGHSSLFAAVDAEIEVRNLVSVGNASLGAVGAGELRISKQKDDGENEGIEFAVQRVFLGWSEDAGEDLGGLKDRRHAITSLAVREWRPGEPKPGVRVLDQLTDHARDVLDALREFAPNGMEADFTNATQAVRRRLGTTRRTVWRELDKVGAIVRDKARGTIAVSSTFAEANAAEED